MLSTIAALTAILFATDWTGLMYMAADNDLAPWADSDLVEISQVNLGNDVQILIQLDKPNTGAGRYIAGAGGVNLIANLGTVDMCDWRVLGDFLSWGISNYPAKRYFLVLWDHGTGWTLQPRRTFGSDWSSGHQMSVAGGDLNRAMQYMYASTGVKIDLVIFDACLMQQIEVAGELTGFAETMAGFQTLCPAPGLNYRRFIGELNRRPNMSKNELASIMVATTVEEYTDKVPVSVGALDLDRFEDLQDRLNSMVEVVTADIPPSAVLEEIRSNVQTIPSASNVPSADDDFVDLGDLLNRLGDALPYTEIDDLREMYEAAVIDHGYWSDVYTRTSGVTVWYPLHYYRFKSLIGLYLQLDWSSCLWASFLNWWYNADDVRPQPALISAGQHGKSVFLNWSRCFDLAPVVYTVLEGLQPRLIFSDSCENEEQLYLQGFVVNSDNPYSGARSLFSGNASNLDNSAWTKDPIKINKTGLLVMQLNYNTEDLTDSLIVEYGSFKDIFYGNSSGWIERRVILPAGDNRLRIKYRTNTINNRGGAYIDEIQLYELDDCRFLRRAISDTSLTIYNPLYGDRNYAVFAVDRYNNMSNLSNFSEIVVSAYADPFSIPNPFSTACTIILDYPEDIDPTVRIYSIDGRHIRKFPPNMIEDARVYWDGTDEDGNECGAGLYYVLLTGENFRQVGKIARQR